MKKRGNHDAALKARVALEAVNGERTVSELAAAYGVQPTMIHQWKRSFLEGAVGILERGGKAATIACTLIETAKLNAVDPHACPPIEPLRRHWFEPNGEAGNP